MSEAQQSNLGEIERRLKQILVLLSAIVIVLAVIVALLILALLLQASQLDKSNQDSDKAKTIELERLRRDVEWLQKQSNQPPAPAPK